MTDNNGQLEVWLSVADYAEYLTLTDKTATEEDEDGNEISASVRLQTQHSAIAEFCVSKKVIVSWSYTTQDGTPLDPSNLKDWAKLHIGDYSAIRLALFNPGGTAPKG